MTDAEFSEVERSLWLGGPVALRAWVAADWLMVCPAPAGNLDSRGILDGLAAALRWVRLEMSDQRPRRAGDRAVVLAYLADAARPQEIEHGAFCSSSYVAVAGAWWLVQQQQTPA